MTLIGLDPSIRYTGMAIKRPGDTIIRTALIDTNAWKRTRGLGRMVRAADEVRAFCALGNDEEALVAIEDTGRPQGASRRNISLHDLIRIWLADNAQVSTLVVAPAQLKLFLTGKGGADVKKGQTGGSVIRLWGSELDGVPPEDALEAVGFLQMAQCYLDMQQDRDAGAWLQYQRDVVYYQRQTKRKGEKELPVRELERDSFDLDPGNW